MKTIVAGAGSAFALLLIIVTWLNPRGVVLTPEANQAFRDFLLLNSPLIIAAAVIIAAIIVQKTARKD